MFPMQRMPSSSIDDTDALYSEQFHVLITEFVKLTNNEIHVRDVCEFIERFKESVILKVLISDPKNPEAFACVTNFLSTRQMLPQVFLTRLVAVASCKMRITPLRFGSGAQLDSCVATLMPGNVAPPKHITTHSAQSMRNLLNEDTKHATPYKANTSNISSIFKIKLNNALVNQLINAQIDYYRIVEEGHRQNGISVDNYVKLRRSR